MEHVPEHEQLRGRDDRRLPAEKSWQGNKTVDK